MPLEIYEKPRFATDVQTSRGVLTGTTIGTLGSDTNGQVIVPAPLAFGSRVVSLIASTNDNITINIFLYGLTGSSVRPIGLINVPASAGNTFAARVNVDLLLLASIPGLQVDPATGKPFILLGKNEVLKGSTIANLTANTSCWISAERYDYLG
jgi:hypothetical protein